jgi:hypothetical protein
MFRGLNDSLNIAETNIVNRNFESITITYQQLNQDAPANTNMIIATFNSQFRNMMNNTTSNFNIMKISFQTMDRNDQ